jgi:sulfur-carrier protein
MTFKVLFFGALADFAGRCEMELENLSDVEALKEHLEGRYSGFSKQKYRVAINRKLVNGNNHLSDGSTVAFLPPFAGG